MRLFRCAFALLGAGVGFCGNTVLVMRPYFRGGTNSVLARNSVPCVCARLQPWCANVRYRRVVYKICGAHCWYVANCLSHSTFENLASLKEHETAFDDLPYLSFLIFGRRPINFQPG